MTVEHILVCDPRDAASLRRGGLHRAADIASALRAAAEARRAGVVFAGAGRALFGRAAELVALAREAGLRDVSLRASALAGLAPATLPDLAAAGLRAIEVPWLTGRAADYDAYVGRSGAHAALAADMAAIAASPVALRVRLLLSTWNAATPADILDAGRDLLARFPGVERVIVGLHEWKGRPATAALPAPEMLAAGIPALMAALTAAGVPSRITADSGLAACLFHADPRVLARFHRGPALDASLLRRSIVRLAPCEGCAAADWCPGLHAGYLRGPAGGAGAGALLRPFGALPEVLGADADPWAEQGDGRSGPLRNRGARVRLRTATSFGDYVASRWDDHLWGDPKPAGLYIARADYDALAVDGAAGPRVRLVRCPCLNRSYEFNFFSLPPLSVMSLAATLRERGFPVDLRDLAVDVQRGDRFSEADRAVLWDHERLQRHLAGAADETVAALVERAARLVDPAPGELVGLSLETPEDLTFAALLAPALQRLADVRVVLGGRLVYDVPDLLRRHPEIECVVRGEGELPLLLLAAAQRGQWHPLRIPNLVYRRGGEVCETPRAVHDLDIFAAPVPDGLRLDRYADDPAFPDGPGFPYFFVNGCPFRCAFCGSHTYGSWRAREPSRVAQHLGELVRRHGLRRFFFLNTLLNVRRDYVEAIVAALEAARLDIEWTDCWRANPVEPALFERLRRVGCANLTWGIDAPSQKLQRLMDKNIDIEGSIEQLAAAKRAGIRNTLSLIAGLPHEDDDDRDAFIAYLRRVRPYCDAFQIHRFRYHHMARLYLEADRFGVVPRDDGGYDEVGGLRFEEKQERILAFRARLRAEVGIDV